MLNLNLFRSKDKGLSELVPYALIAAPGVILNKDGSFMAAWEFRGQDTASSTPEDLNYVAAQVNSALLKLGSGWMLHVDAVRRPASNYPDVSLSHFPDRVTQMIDDERRKFFSSQICFETLTVLNLTYKPAPSLVAGMLGSDQSLEKALTDFQRTVDDFAADLSSVLDLNRLGEYEDIDEYGFTHIYSTYLSYLEDCITGEFAPTVVPSEAFMYLDSYLGSKDLVGGQAPMIGDKHIAALTVDGFPQESYPAILDSLSGLPVSYRFSTRYIMLDQQDAIKAVEDYRKGWNQQIYRFMDKYLNNPNAKPNRDAWAMNEDAEQAKAKVQSGLINFGKLTSTVILLSDDEELLAREAQTMVKEFGRLGFKARLETYNAIEAWQGSLPGNSEANIRKPLLSTMNLAHILPLASIWPGLDYNPCPMYLDNSPPLMVCTTDGSTPFRLNLHEGDIGHSMIIGPTGSGKSTLVSLICAQFRRYPGAQVFVFDKGMSLFPLCKAVGGQHYEIGEDKLSFAPLQDIDESESEMAWASNWIANLVELRGMKVLPNNQNAINDALKQLAANPRNIRSLTDFYDVVQDSEVKEAIKHYTQAGAMGTLLDAETDSLNISDFLVFELEELMNMGDQNLIPVLLYLFRRIEKSLKGQPSIVVLEEGWKLLGHPVFRLKIREWYKVMRKLNCIVLLATQSLSDAVKSDIMDVIAESCPTKILLPNNEAGHEAQFDLYTKQIGLNRRQVGIISTATKKQDYYVFSHSGRRLIQLAIGPIAKAFVGKSSKKDIARIKELIAMYGDEAWIDHWLAECHAA